MSRWSERLRALVRARRRAAGPPSWDDLQAQDPAPQHPASGVLRDLDPAQLCALWRKSAAGLSGASSIEQHLAVVDARVALLAELERRDPAPMAAWLAVGGSDEPAGPTAYLVDPGALPGHRGDRPAVGRQQSRER